jgi:phosphohistidine phosphatase SixA
MLATVFALSLISAVPEKQPVAAVAENYAVRAEAATAVVGALSSEETPLQLHASPHAYLMVEALRRGGLVLFVRHGITSLDGADHADVQLTDCKTQRVLSSAGRALATETGSALRELRLPIEYVLTSAYCRCRETADLMFGTGLRVADLSVDERRDDAAGMQLLSVMARMPTSKANVVIVGHLPSALQAYGVMPDEGEMLVIDPTQGQNGHALIGHITATQWIDIARDYRRYGDRIARAVEAMVREGANSLHNPAADQR